jgi:hypothetical protein
MSHVLSKVAKVVADCTVLANHTLTDTTHGIHLILLQTAAILLLDNGASLLAFRLPTLKADCVFQLGAGHNQVYHHRRLPRYGDLSGRCVHNV